MPLLKQLADLGRAPKVLLLGSGGLSIGQAGEFDYSGTQAIKALIEEKIEVIVVNPNIATVQTNPIPGVKVYLYPVETEWVEKVIQKEKPDAIIAGFGGQTALNCLMALDETGILKKYNVLNLGTPAAVLRLTEDRDDFAQKMRSINMPVPSSFACETLEQALDAANSIGYPVIVRAAFALGGLGSGFASSDEQLKNLVQPALASSPQVLVEKSLKGWKEVEYEVMRDSQGNTITICNMENFDPLGIHTGDSIVVCPSQSLSDDEYQILRNAAITIVSSLGIVGECNVQYALDPKSLDFYIIEVNARLSRSSALASKASGYPIAYIAAKVVLGYDLLELKNPVTGITYSFFEPALDYVTIKMPRWDLLKFQGVNRNLGSTMKSVGEVMAIGRSFPEAIQKATRMVTEHPEGLSMVRPEVSEQDLVEELSAPTDKRLYAVVEAFRRGWSIEKVADLSAIDKWFLYNLFHMIKDENEIRELGRQGDKSLSLDQFMLKTLNKVSGDQWRHWKLQGFGDEQIAAVVLRAGGRPSGSSEVRKASMMVRKLRLEFGVKPVIKKIDTTAGEYPSPSNYLYMSYGGLFSDPLPDDQKVFSAVVLGGGSYRIGTSVEFDWCAVSCSRKLQESGWRSIIVNCNPETVSTDYNSSDRLYFEELSLERILDIADVERPVGVVCSMGGQLPNRLAKPLADAGLKLLGHKHDSIDRAEDRSRFSALLDELGIGQPRWIAAKDKKDIQKFIEEVGFPVLIRPSYVLSGAAMSVAYDDESLQLCLTNASDVSPDHPVVISEFIEGAREIELDGVAKNGEILTAIVSEHIENAGVHSGDATLVVPAQKLYVETVRRVRKAGRAIAQGLNLNGPFNMQFLAKEGDIKVIECNARAARSFPFVSKTVGLNLADVATDVMIGGKPNLARFNEDDLPYVGVKAAMFSFKRLGGADPILGVEMASTGEVGCIGENVDHALLLAMEAAGVYRPEKGVLVSSGSEKEKLRFLPAAQVLVNLGLSLFATKGTAKYLQDHGIPVTALDWPGEGPNDVIQAIKDGKVDFVINIPKSSQRRELTRGSLTRQAAVKFGCSLLTNMEIVSAYVQALDRCPDFLSRHEVLSLPSYRS
ncbi:carbamoyl-phosphate synthase (glutamine-hydrolyzing) large subunit [Oligoflexus tunisiensis]|uniref:carbamoyl-phosphate synthase (glutamine-hydrolyzing) large subunit n=1 Tax=Oligoflexus tunisiensis TaxID=708132 RepID=UPI000B216045|nr:carbamoyl-phosphate synthase (glutamine-hydrolyzing) large subunit [Oligoflexus tunisiensis]